MRISDWSSDVGSSDLSRLPMSGLTKVRREHALASSTSDSAQAMALSGRIGSPGRGQGGLCLQPLVVLGLAPGAVGHLPLELAAGGGDVVAADRPSVG